MTILTFPREETIKDNSCSQDTDGHPDSFSKVMNLTGCNDNNLGDDMTQSKSTGWIKIHRTLTEWEWYNDSQTVHFFLHCIMRAGHAPAKYRGLALEAGQFTSSRGVLSEQTGISIQSIRTIEERLVKAGNLTIKSTNKFILYTVVNYKEFQQADEKPASTSTNNQQTSNNQSTTNKNKKNYKNYKKEGETEIFNEGKKADTAASFDEWLKKHNIGYERHGYEHLRNRAK